MRKITTIALAATLFTLAGQAGAQGFSAPFGTKGQLTLSAERLFGFHWVKNNYEVNDEDTDASGTAVGIGWLFAHNMQFNQPRAGVDYFLTDNLSLGANLGFFAMDGDDGMADQNGVLFYPRVGYNIPLTPSISFYPRGGIEIVSVGDATVFGIGGEANFVFLPRPDWGFLLSPTLDLAPFGEIDQDPGEDIDYSSYSIGISVGILGIL